MTTTTFFEIPDDGEKMAKLVEAIPLWSCMSGALTAPAVLVTSGMALAGTGIELNRYDDPGASIVGLRRPDVGRLKPDLEALIVGRMMPGFVTLDMVGYDRNAHTFGQAKRIVCGLLRMGYRGWLSVYNGFHRDNTYDNAARCSIQFAPWNGAPMMDEEAGPQPARMKLEWEPRYGGKKADVVPLETACAALGLRPYRPGARPERDRVAH
jgi:hypothetical protein